MLKKGERLQDPQPQPRIKTMLLEFPAPEKTTHFTTTQGGSQTFASVQELIKILGDSSVLSTITEELLKDQASRVGIEPTTSLAELLKKLIKATQKTTQVKQQTV